jgi:hypothetical protein
MLYRVSPSLDTDNLRVFLIAYEGVGTKIMNIGKVLKTHKGNHWESLVETLWDGLTKEVSKKLGKLKDKEILVIVKADSSG